MTKSMQLLHEALSELQELADQAKRENHLIYEGMGYTPYQIVLMEAEAEGDEKKGPGFLKRAAGAVKKLSKAADAAVVELEGLNSTVGGIMPKTGTAIANAIKAIKKAKPGTGFLGKLGSGSAMAVRALFGKEDDPAEEVAKIVADSAAFQSMIGNVIKQVTSLVQMNDQTLAGAIKTMGGNPETDLATIKEKLKSVSTTPLSDLLENEDFAPLFDAIGFNEATVKDAISDSVKPAEGMFSGMKSLGASLGIGFGGDVPFNKHYGGNAGSELLADILGASLEQLGALGKAPPEDKGSTDTDLLQQSMQDLAATEEAMPADALKPSSPDAGTTPDAEAGGEAATQAGGAQPAASASPMAAKLEKVLADAGITNPAAAKEKFAKLVDIELTEARAFSLYDLLQEKAVRYQEIVDELEEFLPEDEKERIAAIRKLSDEMKVELGTEYTVVGIPDTDAAEIEAMRAEIEALKQALNDIQDPEARDAAVQQVTTALTDQGVDPGVASAVADPETPAADAAAAAEENENTDELESVAGVDDLESLVPETEDDGTATEADAEAKEAGVIDWVKGKAGAAWKDGKKKFMNVMDKLSAEDMMVLAAAAASDDPAAQEKAAKVLKRVAADQIKDDAGQDLGDIINSVAGLEGTSADEKSDKKDKPADEESDVTVDVKKGEIYQYTTADGKKTYPVKIDGEPTEPKGDGKFYVNAILPNKDKTGWSKSVNNIAVSGIDLEKKFDSDKDAFPPEPIKTTYKDKDNAEPGSWWPDTPGMFQTKVGGKEAPFGAINQKGVESENSFASEEDAKKYAISERRAQIAVAKMRGWLLSETGDFRRVSTLSPSGVVSEYYRRGGTNDMVKESLRSHSRTKHTIDRWAVLAGFQK